MLSSQPAGPSLSLHFRFHPAAVQYRHRCLALPATSYSSMQDRRVAFRRGVTDHWVSDDVGLVVDDDGGGDPIRWRKPSCLGRSTCSPRPGVNLARRCITQMAKRPPCKIQAPQVPYFDFRTVVPLKRSIKSSAVRAFLKSLLMDFWRFLKSVIRASP